MFKSFYQKHKDTFENFSAIFLHNTILYRGLVLAPVVIASNCLKNGVVLGIAFMIITFVTVFLSSFVPKKFPYSVRVILYTLLSSLVFIPTALLLNSIMPVSVYNVGIFLPLLITNSLIVSRSESRFFKMKKGLMVIDLICNVVGFFLIICLVGSLREIFSMATLWDIPITFISIRKIPALVLPFAGFILVGFMAAILQRIRIYLTEGGENKNV